LRHNAATGIADCLEHDDDECAGAANGDDKDDDDDVLYIFETPTTQVRNDIIQRWKLIIARFASLAVLEDADAILSEYFATASTTAAGPPPPMGDNCPINLTSATGSKDTPSRASQGRHAK
jgi:hypothetical protein